ncbi:MAG: glucosaminidase domain-containing protein [Bacteroidales bacterium]|nr:glucosaminidase domain-containing protein [Bacteroidales bacterium]
MKKVFIVLALSLGLAASAQREGQSPQERYISRYAGIAVNEMYRSGVPASITLAQGIIESSSGASKLAAEGNNHFGIKCHNSWNGRTMRADDDRRNECFRVYDSAEESFRDHSDFLRYRDRYKFLFDFQTVDYKSWAYGLKQAGYATDPSYAAKLIKCVEDYGLSRYDRMTLEQVLAEAGQEAERPAEAVALEEIPDSPLKIEAGGLYTGSAGEEYRFSLSRTLYSRNGVPFVFAVEGESYASLAKRYHLLEREILKYNDVSKGAELHAGDVVYLEPKKTKAAAGLDKFIVGEDPESFHAICQRFAVREKSVRKLNGLPSNYEPREGDELLLRPESKLRKLWKKR